MTSKSPSRNSPCPCGSGKKFKQCCALRNETRLSNARPTDSEISHALQTAVGYHQAGHLQQAEAIYRQILQAVPNHPDALHFLGLTASQMGKHEQAIELIGRALAVAPSYAAAHYNLGDILKAHGEVDRAIASYHQAINCEPDYPSAHNNLGIALKSKSKLEEAATSFNNAIKYKPDYAEAYYNLASTLQELNRLEEATARYRQAIDLKPSFADAHYNLGLMLKAQGDLEGAIASYRKAIHCKPDYTEALNNLGIAFHAQGKLVEAVASYRKALEFDPGHAKAHYNLGIAFHAQGKLVEAVASYRKALEFDPGLADAHSNLIFALDMMVEQDTPSLQAERKRWGGAHASALYGSPSFANIPDPARRLRIGYVSADFMQHSASIVFGAMLTKFDPAAFEVFAYSNSAREDTYTRLFQQSVSHWKKITGLSDQVVADLIRQDAIDILVDLSGHSGGNRLLVFARKPAPIQVTAWGYIGGTGMDAMDVFFADPVMVPPEEKQFYTEDVRYLPNAVGAFFPEPFPAVNTLPALSAGIITFGSFNRLAKISEEAFKTWAQVLLAVPASKIVLKTAELDDVATKSRAIECFVKAGIDPQRIVLLGKTPWADHMAAFNQVDIALDPFPHGGGVTTLEELMMGIPVITLRWQTLVGRLSASILTTLGLTDWIAETSEQYIALAVQKARDLAALATLRAQLRNIFTTSIIGNQQAYVQAVEQEYRKLWQEWCQRQTLLD